jgi:hypothetical protein
MIHVMLPAQYLRQAGGYLVEPQKRLMLAVLKTVVDDCQGPVAEAAEGRARSDARAYEQATAYVASTDRSWPFSFENLCEAVGLDPGILRQGIRRMHSPAA